MIVLNMAAILIWMFIIPFFCGAMPVRHMEEEHKNIGMLYVSGYFVMFALFQIVFIPFIVLELPFTFGVVAYAALLVIYIVASDLVARRKKFGYFADITFSHVKKTLYEKRTILWILVVLCIVIQIGISFFYQYSDGDDAFYIASSLDTLHFDTMYKRIPETGESTILDIRHALAPVPVFFAFLSKATGIHPTVIAHTLFPIVLIILTYAVYEKIARVLCRGNEKQIPLFMLFVIALQVYGNVSIYTGATFFLTRTWQGKSILANLVIPAMFLCLLWMAQKRFRAGNFIFLLAVSTTAAFTSTLGTILALMLIGMGGLLIAVVQKDFKVLYKAWIGVLPAFVYGFLYFLLR